MGAFTLVRRSAGAGHARRAAVLACAAIALLASVDASAATTSATARVAIVRPGTLVKADDLDFGAIVPGPAAGTVIINQNTCARSSTGGATPVGAAWRCAQFAGEAQIGIVETVAISANTITLTRGGGGSMTVNLAVRGGTGTRLFPGTGVQLFFVGGTLHVGANQAPGTYTGTFSMTVNYF
jgi:hypothetical protein